RRLCRKAAEGEWEKVKKWIEQRVDVNARCRYLETAIFKAIRLQNEEMVRLLLKSGARLDVENSFGRTPLQQAESHGLTKLVTILKASTTTTTTATTSATKSPTTPAATTTTVTTGVAATTTAKTSTSVATTTTTTTTRTTTTTKPTTVAATNHRVAKTPVLPAATSSGADIPIAAATTASVDTTNMPTTSW
ncbi:unnamed protein product, partial [Meganyctiphanes norvegica]